MPRHATDELVRKQFGSWQKMVVVFDKSVVIPATPNAILFDEEVNLGPWGGVATTYRIGNFGYLIEKPDGQGGWTPTIHPDGGVLPVVPGDPAGYEAGAEIICSPMPRPKHPSFSGSEPLAATFGTRGANMGMDWILRDGMRFDTTNPPQEEDEISRVRIQATRSSRVYSPAEQAAIDALGYRLRVVLHLINTVAWEVETAIPDTADEIFIEEELDLADFGLVSSLERMRFVAEVRRDGRTVKTLLGREYVPGEALDHPSYPIRVATIGVMPGNDWRNDNNGVNAWIFYDSLYGRNFVSPGLSGRDNNGDINSGTHLGPPLGYCPESAKQLVKVVAWRSPNGLDPTYFDGSLSEAVIDLTTVDAGMGATFFGQSLDGADARIEFVPATVLERNANNAYLYPDGVDTVLELVPLDYPTGGLIARYIPGAVTLQTVFNAITDHWTNRGGYIRPGVLTSPAYVLSQTSPFTVSTGGAIVPQTAPTVPSEATGATLRIRLLVAPPNRLGMHPFDTKNTSDNPRQVLLQTIEEPRSVDATPMGLWWHNGYRGRKPYTENRLKLYRDSVAFLYDIPAFSAEIVGTGEQQAFPHGTFTQGNPPYNAIRHRVIPVKWPAGTAVDFTTSYDADNVYVTMTLGVTYLLLIWPGKYGY